MHPGPNRDLVTVWIALGSNLGDRHEHLRWAVDQLRDLLSELRCSQFYLNPPVGVSEPQPDYLNAVAVGQTTLAPEDLLDQLLGLERERGRERRGVRSPRTLDLDLLFYGDLRLDTPGLSIPHPRLRERRFVLEPMAELDPAWIDPVTGKTVKTLLHELPVQRTGA